MYILIGMWLTLIYRSISRRSAKPYKLESKPILYQPVYNQPIDGEKIKFDLLSNATIKILYGASIFNFVLDAVYDALSERGYRVEKATEVKIGDDTSIYIMCDAFRKFVVPKYYIAYNWEQLTVNGRSWDHVCKNFN